MWCPRLIASTSALLFALSSAAWAQSWPSKPIRLVVTYPPGGGADIMARLVSPKVSQSVGQSVLVENRPGATGQIAADLVAKSAPDGYTLMLDASSFVVNPSIYPSLPYDPEKAFAPITLLARFPNMLVVTPSFAAKSVADLVAMARAKPGQIAFASSGNGSAQHLAAELFRQRAGIDMVHVPYKGGALAMTDVMAGQVPVFFANMASGLQHVKSGRLRALAVTGGARSASLPDTPTLAEAGVTGAEVYEWNAVFAPAGTPTGIVRRLHGEIASALRQADVSERITALGGEIVASSPEDTARYLKEQTALWSRIVKTAGIKVD